MLHAVVLVSLFLHAEAPKDDEAIKKDLAKMQGRWKLVRFIEKGESVDPKDTDFRGLIVTIKDNTLVWKEHTDTIELRIKLDPSTKPSKLELTWPKSEKNATNHAIYEFGEDELWIATGTWLTPNEMGDRPPNFVYRDSARPRAKFVFVFKREQPKK